MKIEKCKFEIEQKVKFAASDHVGIVTGLSVRKTRVSYMVTWAHDLTERYHDEFELEGVEDRRTAPGLTPLQERNGHEG